MMICGSAIESSPRAARDRSSIEITSINLHPAALAAAGLESRPCAPPGPLAPAAPRPPASRSVAQARAPEGSPSPVGRS